MKNSKDKADIVEPRKVVVGDKHAPVTLMMFGDYESEACAQANEVVAKLLERYPDKVKFIFRHYPLLNVHQKALKAAEAAIAAAQEGKFWEMHKEIFANRRQLGVFNLKNYAREVGITNKKFLDELLNGTFGSYVQADLAEGHRLGVTAVPAFFINGKRFPGEPTFKQLSTYIEALPGRNHVKEVTRKAA